MAIKKRKKRIKSPDHITPGMFWNKEIMRVAMIELREMNAFPKRNARRTNELWMDVVNKPVQDLISWSIASVDKNHINNEDLRAELQKEIWNAIINKLNLEPDGNAMSYLTAICRTKMLDWLVGTGATGFDSHKIKQIRYIDEVPYADIVLGSNETAKRPKDGTIKITCYAKKYQFLESTGADIQDRIFEPGIIDAVDWHAVMQYIPDCDGSLRTRDIAIDVLRVLQHVKNNGLPKYLHKSFQNWLFNTAVTSLSPNRLISHEDKKLALATCKQAFDLYRQYEIHDVDRLYGKSGYIPRPHD